MVREARGAEFLQHPMGSVVALGSPPHPAPRDRGFWSQETCAGHALT